RCPGAPARPPTPREILREVRVAFDVDRSMDLRSAGRDREGPGNRGRGHRHDDGEKRDQPDEAPSPGAGPSPHRRFDAVPAFSPLRLAPLEIRRLLAGIPSFSFHESRAEAGIVPNPGPV